MDHTSQDPRHVHRRISELVSGLIGTEVPRKGLRVRVPCPPLKWQAPLENRTTPKSDVESNCGVFCALLRPAQDANFTQPLLVELSAVKTFQPEFHTANWFARSFALLSIFWAITLSLASAQEVNYRFPVDACVLCAKGDFGAVGDGKADDTEALQRAIDASCSLSDKHRGQTNVLWIPNGIYRVTKTLVVTNALGPWLYGQSRDGVVIKLDDGVQGVTSVIRTHPREQGPTSADWFMRNLRHFTVDVGNNPQVDGIRYYATNSGTLADVRVIGRGKVGVNSSFLDQSGPNLIRDVEVEGFETGILSQWIWSQTLSNVMIKNCRKVGVEVSANVAAIENLRVANTPMAIKNTYPNDWYHWGGVVALVGGRFAGGDPQGPAIENTSLMYARDVEANGFSKVLSSQTEGGSVEGSKIDEYHSHSAKKLFEDAKSSSLGLTIKPTPLIPWENEMENWLCIDDFGANGNDHQDDTDAIELAVNKAVEQGKTTVYFRGCGGPEPNWFKMSRRVKVPAPIRRVIGLGWGRILRESDEAGFEIDDESSEFVHFQNLDSFGGPPIIISNRSQTKTLVVESCGVSIVGEGQGDIFVSDCPANLELREPGQHCWARHLNAEGTTDVGLIRNRGGILWCFGVKHEGRGIRFATTEGGKTEVFGVFNYGGNPEEMDMRPMFLVEDSSFSVAGLREIAFDSHTAYVKVKETQKEETKILDKTNEGGWIGWALYRSQR
jgi:Pectate lyase superfamily protein